MTIKSRQKQKENIKKENKTIQRKAQKSIEENDKIVEIETDKINSKIKKLN